MFTLDRNLQPYQNLKFKNKDVYLFEDTPELSQVIVKYKTLKQTKEKYYDFDKRGRSKT